MMSALECFTLNNIFSDNGNVYSCLSENLSHNSTLLIK